MSEWIETGKIVNAHGIRGEVKLLSSADEGTDFSRFSVLRIDQREYPVQAARTHSGCVLLKLKGIEDRTVAESFRNKTVFAKREEFRLAEGRYFIADLIGLKVVDEEGVERGTLTDVLKTRANDVYELTQGERKTYIPAIKDCILSVDLSQKTMLIHAMEGLFDAL